jgi:hypothetical protein
MFTILLSNFFCFSFSLSVLGILELIVAHRQRMYCLSSDVMVALI